MLIDQQLNIIQDKLQQLFKLNQRLQKENEKLNEDLSKAKQKEQQAADKIHELEEQVAVLKLASGEMTEKDKKSFEKKLNQYIKDVDRCINLLSE